MACLLAMQFQVKHLKASFDSSKVVAVAFSLGNSSSFCAGILPVLYKLKICFSSRVSYSSKAFAMDYLVKSLAYDGQLRAYAVDATKTVRQAQEYHDTWSAASAALGRTLVATFSSSLVKTSSVAPGITWIKKPPAVWIVLSSLTKTDNPTADGELREIVKNAKEK